MSAPRPPAGSPAPPGSPASPAASPENELFRPVRTSHAPESVTFLRQRIALFGQVAFWLDFGFFVLVNGIAVATGALAPSRILAIPANVFLLVALAVFGLAWASCRFLPLRRAALVTVDASATILATLAFALGAMAHPDGGLVLPAVLALTHVLLARAVLVPSTLRRTLLVSLAAGAPVIWAGLTQAQRMPGFLAPSGGWPDLQAASVVPWVLLACALATLTSRVLFGLRQEVTQARRFGQYTLEEKISEGGMGEVWRARHALLRRPTAIKLLRPGQSGSVADARFEREVRLTARLTHPNTVAIYDYGRTAEGVFYYAMEFLEGVNLHDLVRRDGPLPPGRAIHVLRQICGSLAEAHEIGLVHRDVKPANVILCERGALLDVAKVVDFGLVKDVGGDGDGDTSLSRSDTIAGTPRHMAPEAISSPGNVGHSVDLYGVGTIAYFLVTGEHVFEGENFLHLCAQHLTSPPEPPSRRGRNTAPPDLERIIMRALEKHPSRRWGSARQIEAELAACRDAFAWTQDDARLWWSERWPVIQAGRAAEPDASSFESSREAFPTLSVLHAERPKNE